MRALNLPLLIAALALAPHVVSPASAMPPPETPAFSLTAQGVCQAGTVGVQFTVSSAVSNPTVAMLFNSVQVGTYSLSPPSFSDTLAAPAVASVIVTARFDGTWGNGAPGGQNTSVTVALPTDCGTTASGRFTGGGKSIDSRTGLKVTKGFTIHCDLLLSNNLEINWPGADSRTNQFHMLEHTAARCTDDPSIDQRPPVAPVDRIDGVGTGRFNGDLGYTVFFTLIDAGEPGGSDMIGFRIVNATTGVEVLNLPLQTIVGGNVQAHFDQPHK